MAIRWRLVSPAAFSESGRVGSIERSITFGDGEGNDILQFQPVLLLGDSEVVPGGRVEWERGHGVKEPPTKTFAIATELPTQREKPGFRWNGDGGVSVEHQP